MNIWIGIGRATKDCELTKTTNDISVCKFTIAVDRKFKDSDGNKITDYFNIVAWRGLADICSKYVKKGQQVAIRGELQTRSYDANDGTKRYITEVVADDLTLLASKKDDNNKPDTNNVQLTKIDDDDLPF